MVTEETNPLTDEKYVVEHNLCQRCNCCEIDWVECPYCGGEGGTDGEELMLEDPMWYSEDDWRNCDACNGAGGHFSCLGNCDENGKHHTHGPA